jgi:hypothetical protein
MPSNQYLNYMAVQAQWDLESSSNSVLSVAKGIFQAATSDNVQPIAILACERFGSTVAMCQETCRKIETAVIPTPKPATIRFLQATVGYATDDSVTHLSKTLAGVQFLGLASAITNTVDHFIGARALQDMLTSSAVDKTLIPTTRQLKDLLSSLEARCHKARFADSVVGWQVFLSQSIRDQGEYRRSSAGEHHPAAKGIENLVDVFRQLSRIGPSSVVKATIRTANCVSWTVAFTKWCLGIPPSVYLDNGVPVFEQPESKVAIIVCSDSGDVSSFEVTIHHDTPSLSELLVSEDGTKWNGMVSISHFGQYMLQDQGPQESFAFRTMVQALSYVLRQVIGQNPVRNYEASPLLRFRDDRAVLATLS